MLSVDGAASRVVGWLRRADRGHCRSVCQDARERRVQARVVREAEPEGIRQHILSSDTVESVRRSVDPPG